MAALSYGFDRRLRQGDDVVVDFEYAGGETYGRFLAGREAFDIVRRGRFGWHFSLVPSHGGTAVLTFQPARVRRGGRLEGAAEEVALYRRPLRPRRWRFVSTAGWILDALLRVESSGPTTGFIAEVQLDGLEMAGVSVQTLLAIAFGCWLLVAHETQVGALPGTGGP